MRSLPPLFSAAQVEKRGASTVPSFFSLEECVLLNSGGKWPITHMCVAREMIAHKKQAILKRVIKR
jgi:hypothetical protein